MNRTSRLPYHQNVYDLLDMTPGEYPDAARLIAEHEQRRAGAFPAALGELYIAFGNANPFECYDYPYSPEMILQDWVSWPSDTGSLCLGGFKGQGGDFVWLDGSDDPRVESSSLRGQEELRYSEFLFEEAVGYWYDTRDGSEFWLRTPAEPFAPPIIDFLTEQFGEPERTPRPGDVTTYTYRPVGGTIRVTADHPGHPEPLSAWWVHAESPERLTEFARLLIPWGTLQTTLRPDTDPARDVLRRVRESL